MKMRNAFTLAEVLITLGIIGIVAAMTLPSIIEKYQEKVTVSKVRKMYALLQEAYLRVENKYGPASSWDCPSSAGRNTSYTRLWTSYFVSEFANIKKCSKQKFYESCFNSDYYNLKGQRRWGISEENTEFGYKLPDGGSFILLQNNSFLMHFYYDIKILGLFRAVRFLECKVWLLFLESQTCVEIMSVLEHFQGFFNHPLRRIRSVLRAQRVYFAVGKKMK